MTPTDSRAPLEDSLREPTPPGEEVASARADLRVKVGQDGSAVRTLIVEVGPKRVAAIFDRAYKGIGRGASVKGFRMGKVPKSVLRKLYGHSLGHDVQRVLIEETLPDAIELSGYRPIVAPGLDAPEPVETEGFRYTARLELRPEIQLPDLAGLTATRPDTQVEEAELEERLEGIRESHAKLVEEPEGSAAVTGQVLKIDFQGRIDDELFDGGSAEGAEVELGSDRFIPGFEEQLVGAVAGQDREVEVQFPEDYSAAELAGKKAHFAVQVRAVCSRKKPDLDDEFAKDLGEFETLEELRTKLREQMQEQSERAAKSAVRRGVLDALLEEVDFEVGPATVEKQLEAHLHSMVRRFQGQVPDEVIREQVERAREEGRPGAERRVRERLVLDEVATLCEIVVPDEALDQRLGEMAAAEGMDPKQLAKLAREQGWIEALREELREEQALDQLVAKAKIVGVATD